MHEMALTRYAVEAVNEVAAKEGADRVSRVFLTIGAGRDVIMGLFEKYFSFLAKGTACADAELSVEVMPMQVRCRQCGKVYSVNTRDRQTWPCPDCGRYDYELYSGMEFMVDSVELV